MYSTSNFRLRESCPRTLALKYKFRRDIICRQMGEFFPVWVFPKNVKLRFLVGFNQTVIRRIFKPELKQSSLQRVFAGEKPMTLKMSKSVKMSPLKTTVFHELDLPQTYTRARPKRTARLRSANLRRNRIRRKQVFDFIR